MTNTITSIINTCNIQSQIRLHEVTRSEHHFSDVLAYQIQEIKPVVSIAAAKREDKKKDAEVSNAKTEKQSANEKQMATMRINSKIAAELMLTGKTDIEDEMINPVNYRRAYYMD